MPHTKEHRWAAFLLLVALAFAVLLTVVVVNHGGEWDQSEVNFAGVLLAILTVVAFGVRGELIGKKITQDNAEASAGREKILAVVKETRKEAKEAVSAAAELAATTAAATAAATVAQAAQAAEGTGQFITIAEANRMVLETEKAACKEVAELAAKLAAETVIRRFDENNGK